MFPGTNFPPAVVFITAHMEFGNDSATSATRFITQRKQRDEVKTAAPHPLYTVLLESVSGLQPDSSQRSPAAPLPSPHISGLCGFAPVTSIPGKPPLMRHRGIHLYAEIVGSGDHGRFCSFILRLHAKFWQRRSVYSWRRAWGHGNIR